MNGTLSKWSAILSLYCGIALAASYIVAPDTPEGIIVPLLMFLFYSAIIAGILALIFTMLAFYKKEEGYMKMIGPIVLSLIVLAFVISFVGIMFIGED
ncbi:hypothetical protein [Paucisalibacillus globulus]|uniref:hypothetical protein n=1 Tax=Paucisalibacillus globulus TaxID=351095 RepID=UPI000BB9A8E7|nr:hypothetical protein [Paucisalibacillus globulus]